MPATVWRILKKTQILSNYGLPERENDPSPSKIRNSDVHKPILKKNVKLTDPVYACHSLTSFEKKIKLCNYG